MLELVLVVEEQLEEKEKSHQKVRVVECFVLVKGLPIPFARDPEEPRVGGFYGGLVFFATVTGVFPDSRDVPYTVTGVFCDGILLRRVFCDG